MLKEVQTAMMKKVRAITSDPVHINRHSDDMVMQRLGLLPPGEFMQQVLHNEAEARSRREEGRMHGEVWEAYLRRQFQEVHEQGTVTEQTSAWACPIYSETFETQPRSQETSGD